MSSPTRSIYVVTFVGVSVSAAHDFFTVNPASNRPTCIHQIIITQTSEPASEEEQLLIEIVRGNDTNGSGGSVFTPVPLLSDDAAAAFTARINDTTLASGGAPVILHAEAFNSRTGFYYLPTPELRTVTKLSGVRTVVRLVNAPSDAITFSGMVMVEER